jgi:predicted kinase
VHVRIDSIEQAIRASGVTVTSLDDAGYRAAYAVAADNLVLGWTVIADSVNPLPVTRAAWLEIARRADVDVVEVEIRCSDEAEHRRRVEHRLKLDGQAGPTWQEVVNRDYRPWPSANHVIDTAVRTPAVAASELRAALMLRS